MTTELMREAISKVPKYDTPSWHARVREMGPMQVYAVYRNFYKNGYFDKPKKSPVVKEEYRQMSIFDYI